MMNQPERFNSETVTDSQIERTISFESLGQKFRVELKIPAYINGKLSSEDWDFAESIIREYAEAQRREMALNGSLFVAQSREQAAQRVSKFARQAVYNQFMKCQVRVGHHEGHEVPRCFQ